MTAAFNIARRKTQRLRTHRGAARRVGLAAVAIALLGAPPAVGAARPERAMVAGSAHGWHKRLHRKRAACASTARSASGPACSQSAPASSPAPSPSAGTGAAARLFAPDSAWNRPLSLDAPLDPSSDALVQGLDQEAQREYAATNGPWVNTDSYSVPIYYVGAQQHTVRVTLDRSGQPALQRAFDAVPIPDNAKPASGTDRLMTIYQASTDRMWEFWRASKQSDGWHATWGGAIRHVSSSPGYFTTDAWPGARPSWGAGAASLPLAAGLMTIADLQSGHIDHALAIALPNPRGGVYAWPAQRTDGTASDPNSLPEGAQLRLDPNLDIAALHLPHITEMIAYAAQRYGLIVTNRSSNIVFPAEDATENGPAAHSGGGPVPYYGPGGLFDNMWPYAFLHLFPWDRLQVLKMQLHHTG